jgi:outer membrane protein TolC
LAIGQEAAPLPGELAFPNASAIVQPLQTSDLDLAMPADWRPWWSAVVNQAILGRSERLAIELDPVVVGSLAHSPQVKALRIGPAIQETQINEACANFDTRSFMDSKFTDTSEPVGSTLTTGGPPRYLDQNWTYSAGVRRLAPTGARLEASQKLGYEDSNSVFFVPDRQGTARMTLSLTQPLLNGAGRFYNTSAVVLAQIGSEIAQDQLAKELQNVVLEVQRAYWNLYLQRVLLLQKRKVLAQGRAIYDELVARQGVDVLASQIARAKGAVATRAAAVIRQKTETLNAETRLRTLVNDPALGSLGQELIPIQPPIDVPQKVRLDDSLAMAFASRPEIDQATREIRAAKVRLAVSDNELMPVLNLILSSYVAGLQGDADIGQAFGDQFGAGRPSYSAGVLMEYPFGNRAAQARLKRRRLELSQLTNQLEIATSNVRYEVETAVREVETAHREMMSHYHAIQGGEAEIEELQRRWRLLPGDQPAAGIVLDDLLQAQERLNRAEGSYAELLVTYNIALVQLKRATGLLLQNQEGATPTAHKRAVSNNMPTGRFAPPVDASKAGAPGVTVPKPPTPPASASEKRSATAPSGPALSVEPIDEHSNTAGAREQRLPWPARPEALPETPERSATIVPNKPSSKVQPRPLPPVKKGWQPPPIEVDALPAAD